METWKNEGHGSGRVHVCAAVGSWLHNEASLVERLEVKTMATVKLCSQTHTHRRQKHIVCVCVCNSISVHADHISSIYEQNAIASIVCI